VKLLNKPGSVSQAAFNSICHRLKGSAYFNEPLSRHTSYRIGGLADILFIPQDVEDLQEAIAWARAENLPYFIMGNGSNLLVSDRGFRGLILKIAGSFHRIRFEQNRAIAGAGSDLGLLINQAARHGLFGLPFAVGIPGTVAGAIVMNAGSATLYMGQQVESIVALDCRDLQQKTLHRGELGFQYRRSMLDSGDWVVLEAAISMQEEPPQIAFERIHELLLRRRTAQPLEYPSAGSVFRNPSNAYAGQLIEEAGCKGWRVGDAMISSVHANFIVNIGQATASHVLALMERVQAVVEDHYGLLLQPEIKLLGEWSQSISLWRGEASD
jgi:UDP-N-acetylmuramate dehydrogenase